MVVTGAKRGSATAGMRTPSPEPEPKRQTLTAPSASNHARYRASNAANEQHHPGPGDHH
jgi:hypothetical protein